MNKKQLGKFFTTEVAKILKGFEPLVKGKDVVDMYCGDRALLDWATVNGATSVLGYDVDPAANADIHQDTLLVPVACSRMAVINPPYLGKNKAHKKEAFDKWGVDDLYKAALLSLIGNIDEAIVIMPSNFFMDRDNKTRAKFFDHFHVKKTVFFDTQVFKDTSVRVVAMHCVLGKTSQIAGYTLSDTRIGKDYYDLLSTETGSGIGRLVAATPATMFNSHIKLLATDTGGTRMLGLVEEEPASGKVSDRNIASIVLDKPMSRDNQRLVISQVNALITKYRTQYDSMFLTNFLAGKDHVMRKRIPFKEVYKLIAHVRMINGNI